MKTYKSFFLMLISACFYFNADAQSAAINILTHNSGVVKKGNTIFLEVTITNVDIYKPIEAYKLKPQINIPEEIAVISDTGHILPKGWTIIKNNGSGIFLSNGTAVLEPITNYTLLIAIRGKKAGGPSTILGQLSFSDGKEPGSGTGSLPDDDPADNSSTTTIKVLN